MTRRFSDRYAAAQRRPTFFGLSHRQRRLLWHASVYLIVFVHGFELMAQLPSPVYAVEPEQWRFLRYNEVVMQGRGGTFHYRWGELRCRNAQHLNQVPLLNLENDRVWKRNAREEIDSLWTEILASEVFTLTRGSNQLSVYRCVTIDRLRTHYACLHDSYQDKSDRWSRLALGQSIQIVLELVDARNGALLVRLDSLQLSARSTTPSIPSEVLDADNFQCSRTIGCGADSIPARLRVVVKTDAGATVKIEAAQHQSYASQLYIHELQRKSRNYTSVFSELSYPHACQWKLLQRYLDSMRSIGVQISKLPQHPAEKYMQEYRERYLKSEQTRIKSRSVYESTSDLSMPWIVEERDTLFSLDSLMRFHSYSSCWMIFNRQTRLDSGMIKSPKPVYNARIISLDSSLRRIETHTFNRDLKRVELCLPSAVFRFPDLCRYILLVDGDKRLLGVGRCTKGADVFEKSSGLRGGRKP